MQLYESSIFELLNQEEVKYIENIKLDEKNLLFEEIKKKIKENVICKCIFFSFDEISLLLNILDSRSDNESREISAKIKFKKEERHYSIIRGHVINLTRKIKIFKLIAENAKELDKSEYQEYVAFFGWMKNEALLLPSIRTDTVKVYEGTKKRVEEIINKIFSNDKNCKELILKSKLNDAISELEKVANEARALSKYSCEDVENLIKFVGKDSKKIAQINPFKTDYQNISFSSNEIFLIKRKLENENNGTAKALSSKLLMTISNMRNWIDAHMDFKRISQYYEINFEDLYNAIQKVHSSLIYILCYFTNPKYVIKNGLKEENHHMGNEFFYYYKDFEEDLTILALKKLFFLIYENNSRRKNSPLELEGLYHARK